MAQSSADRNCAQAAVSAQHVAVLQLTKHLAEKDENFCEAMKELSKPAEISQIQRRPVPVMVCMRAAAAKVCGLGNSSFFTIVYLQLQFSDLIQDGGVRRKLGIEWEPNFYADADPSVLSDSIEQNTTRTHTLALVDELIARL